MRVSTAADRELLTGLLAIAVPVEMHRMARMCEVTGEEYRLVTAKEAAQFIASHGDDLLFRSRKRGNSAKAFAALARGLAAGAFQPGGITFMGTHWCSDHGLCLAAREAARRAAEAEACADGECPAPAGGGLCGDGPAGGQ